jgi:hypothetical protein
VLLQLLQRLVHLHDSVAVRLRLIPLWSIVLVDKPDRPAEMLACLTLGERYDG